MGYEPIELPTAPPRISNGRNYRGEDSVKQVFLGNSVPVYSRVAKKLNCTGEGGAEERTRTSTGMNPLPPQGSVSTNSTTSAAICTWRIQIMRLHDH